MRKRKRFEVVGVAPDGTPCRWQCLAHPDGGGLPAYAREHYERLGYIILDANIMGRQIRPKQPWRVNTLAVLDACRELDVRWPVSIRRTANAKNLHGKHWLRRTIKGGDPFPATPTHVITLAAGMPEAQASEVLWHELAHAMQAERSVRSESLWRLLSAKDMMTLWSVSEVRSRKVLYDERPCEVEARSYEQRGINFPLVLPTRS